MAGVMLSQKAGIVAKADGATRTRASFSPSMPARPLVHRCPSPAPVLIRRCETVCKAAPTTTAPPKASPAPSGTPTISPEVAADLYRDMFLGREFEEMCAQMYYRGKMFGFVHLYSGQEACSTGVIRLLNKVWMISLPI